MRDEGKGICGIQEEEQVFFKKYYLFGCIGSQLWHVGSSLRHARSSLRHVGSFAAVQTPLVAVSRLLSSCKGLVAPQHVGS